MAMKRYRKTCLATFFSDAIPTLLSPFSRWQLCFFSDNNQMHSIERVLSVINVDLISLSDQTELKSPLFRVFFFLTQNF